jgi:hypothetical protein
MPKELTIEEKNLKMMRKLGFSDNMKRCDGYLVEDLHAIFNKYCNKEEWKYPFEAVITSKKEKDMLMRAIIFMFGDKPTAKRIGKSVWVITTRGYQAW